MRGDRCIPQAVPPAVPETEADTFRRPSSRSSIFGGEDGVGILDIKTPSVGEALRRRPPEELVKSILAKQQRIVEFMGEIGAILRTGAGT